MTDDFVTELIAKDANVFRRITNLRTGGSVDIDITEEYWREQRKKSAAAKTQLIAELKQQAYLGIERL